MLDICSKNLYLATPLELTNRDVRLGPNSYVMDWMALGELRALDYQELMIDSVFKSMIRELVLRRSTQLLHYRIGLAEAIKVRSVLGQYLG